MALPQGRPDAPPAGAWHRRGVRGPAPEARMSDPVTPTPEPSHWGGIHRSGGITGMPKNPFRGITRTVTGRRLLVQVSLVVFATIGGYLIAAFWFFPAPLFSESVAVPRVIELDATVAQERLIAAGLRVRREGEMPHPRLPT